MRRLQDFGAFVDIGGVDGLLPVSQMRWTRVKHPGDVLQVGQSVKVQVIKFDREAGKITLSLKNLEQSPWATAATTYTPGSVVRGRVSRLAEFGAFVELEPAIDGLIHISELSHQRVRRVGDLVQEGQEVEVKVLEFDAERRRIALSLKQIAPPPEPEPVIESATESTPEPAAEPTPPKPKKPAQPLKGGLGGSSGPLFS